MSIIKQPASQYHIFKKPSAVWQPSGRCSTSKPNTSAYSDRLTCSASWSAGSPLHFCAENSIRLVLWFFYWSNWLAYRSCWEANPNDRYWIYLAYWPHCDQLSSLGLILSSCWLLPHLFLSRLCTFWYDRGWFDPTFLSCCCFFASLRVASFVLPSKGLQWFWIFRNFEWAMWNYWKGL